LVDSIRKEDIKSGLFREFNIKIEAPYNANFDSIVVKTPKS
jgi:hypothetical protein